MTLLCSYCTSTIDGFDELSFNDEGIAFHLDCPQIADFVGDVEDEFDD